MEVVSKCGVNVSPRFLSLASFLLMCLSVSLTLLILRAVVVSLLSGSTYCLVVA